MEAEKEAAKYRYRGYAVPASAQPGPDVIVVPVDGAAMPLPTLVLSRLKTAFEAGFAICFVGNDEATVRRVVQVCDLMMEDDTGEWSAVQ